MQPSAGGRHKRVSGVNRSAQLRPVPGPSRRQTTQRRQRRAQGRAGQGRRHDASARADGRGTRGGTHPNVPSGGNTTMGSTAWTVGWKPSWMRSEMRLLLPTPAAQWPTPAGRGEEPTTWPHQWDNERPQGGQNARGRPRQYRSPTQIDATHHGCAAPTQAIIASHRHPQDGSPLAPRAPPPPSPHSPSSPPPPGPHQRTVADEDQAHAVLHGESPGVCCGSDAHKRAAARLGQLAKSTSRNCGPHGRAGGGGRSGAVAGNRDVDEAPPPEQCFPHAQRGRSRHDSQPPPPRPRTPRGAASGAAAAAAGGQRGRPANWVRPIPPRG